MIKTKNFFRTPVDIEAHSNYVGRVVSARKGDYFIGAKEIEGPSAIVKVLGSYAGSSAYTKTKENQREFGAFMLGPYESVHSVETIIVAPFRRARQKKAVSSELASALKKLKVDVELFREKNKPQLVKDIGEDHQSC
jgi:hypothetical protein